MVELSKDYDSKLQTFERTYAAAPEDPVVLDEYCDFMEEYLQQGLLEKQVEHMQRNQYTQLLQKKIKTDMNFHSCLCLADNLMKLKDYSGAQQILDVIDKKWQKKWETEGTFFAKEDPSLKKWYGLIEFPYPSGQGLHVGHPRSYTALDIIARKKRLEGYNVLYPIGFDAFGLPAENYAIKNHIHPKITTEKNVNHFREQLKALGFSFDWSREINTTDPNYYKWTQWIFIQLYKHGLAYKTTMPINYCTGCKVGLANEEVVNGVCERCGSEAVSYTHLTLPTIA